MTINGYFDVKKRIACAYNITDILVAFNKETEFEMKYVSFIPYWIIVMSSFNKISKKGPHDTPNLVLSNAKKLIYNFVNGFVNK